MKIRNPKFLVDQFEGFESAIALMEIRHPPIALFDLRFQMKAELKFTSLQALASFKMFEAPGNFRIDTQKLTLCSDMTLEMIILAVEKYSAEIVNTKPSTGSELSGWRTSKASEVTSIDRPRTL